MFGNYEKRKIIKKRRREKSNKVDYEENEIHSSEKARPELIFKQVSDKRHSYFVHARSFEAQKFHAKTPNSFKALPFHTINSNAN